MGGLGREKGTHHRVATEGSLKETFFEGFFSKKNDEVLGVGVKKGSKGSRRVNPRGQRPYQQGRRGKRGKWVGGVAILLRPKAGGSQLWEKS